jgi:hypothetical protein
MHRQSGFWKNMVLRSELIGNTIKDGFKAK